MIQIDKNNFSILDIYSYYDKPILYSCQNEDQLFLVILIDEEIDKFEQWLYRPCNETELRDLKDKYITLYDFFKNQEEFYIRIITPKNDYFTCLPRLQDRYLPDKNTYLV